MYIDRRTARNPHATKIAVHEEVGIDTVTGTEKLKPGKRDRERERERSKSRYPEDALAKEGLLDFRLLCILRVVRVRRHRRRVRIENDLNVTVREHQLTQRDICEERCGFGNRDGNSKSSIATKTAGSTETQSKKRRNSWKGEERREETKKEREEAHSFSHKSKLGNRGRISTGTRLLFCIRQQWRPKRDR
jgi:hypothetical protein